MNKIEKLNQEVISYDTAVDEVDVLIPRYLESIENLDKAENFEDIPDCLHNVTAYWDRLVRLFSDLESWSDDIPFKKIIVDTLQTEMATLERVYLRINLRIEFSQNHWTVALWEAADVVLKRMDEVLEKLEFHKDHADRVLIQEMITKNQSKYQWWILKNHIAHKDDDE